jgi:hypothetical protein
VPGGPTGLCPQQRCTSSLPGAAERGGGGVCPEGWACSWTYNRDTLGL